MARRKNKKKRGEQLPPQPLPPLGDLPPPPMPGGAPLPGLPPLPAPPLPIQNPPAPQPVIEPVESDVAAAEQDDVAITERLQGYASMWRNRTEKPLQQVYGHIDRIGSGDVGSLLDRYADRFGHDLDRDIIVLRQQEREEKLGRLREAPTVELVSEIETDGTSEETGVPTTDERNEIEVQLAHLEDELRRLKPEFQEARDRNDRERIAAIHPVLKSMIEERKILKSILSGEATMDALDGGIAPSAAAVAQVASDVTAEDVSFNEFVAIVDELLGNDLPEEAASAFLNGPEFQVYQRVAVDPAGSPNTDRRAFVAIVDEVLEELPSEAIDRFISSPAVEIFGTVVRRYTED